MQENIDFFIISCTRKIESVFLLQNDGNRKSFNVFRICKDTNKA